MRDQLRYLMEVAEWDNIDLRVLPLASDWHPALEGPFTLIESSHTPVVQIENRRSGLFLHEQDDVQAYRQAADTVRDIAMSPADSTGLIAGVINEMETTA